jgi:two-component system, OmpR family, response regulator
MRVLVVEDDARIAEDAAAALTEAGFVPSIESEGQSGYHAGQSADFAAVVLDLALPNLDGLTILKNWRAEGIWTPVCILTARGSWMERVIGMDAGADDYLPKPFHVEELVARLRALVRRSSSSPMEPRRWGDLALDTRQMLVSMKDQAIPLTPQEFKTLNYLLSNAHRVVPASELIQNLHGEGATITANSMEALIRRIRRKLGKDTIVTRRGQGYAMADRRA